MANCNCCDIGIGCRGAANMKNMLACKKFVAPKDTWKLAELAIAYPTGLNEALSDFPFHTGIDIYLEGGR